MTDNISQPFDPTLIVPYTHKPFVFCLFKSMDNSDITLLNQYGKVVIFGQAYINRPVHTFSFDYLIIDFRDNDHRFYYQKHIMKYHEQYHFILYRYSFETNHGILFHNELVDFPSHQVTKDEFESLLLEKPLPSPNCLLSLCRYCCHIKQD